MNYIFEKNGKYKGLRVNGANENEIAIEQTQQNLQLFESFIKPKLVDGVIVEGATEEEMIEVTPEKVTDIQFISQLALEGISEDSVISIIETLPEPYRTIAMVSFKRETEFYRNNPLMELVRIGFEMTNERLDKIFINASKITNK